MVNQTGETKIKNLKLLEQYVTYRLLKALYYVTYLITFMLATSVVFVLLSGIDHSTWNPIEGLVEGLNVFIIGVLFIELAKIIILYILYGYRFENIYN